MTSKSDDYCYYNPDALPVDDPPRGTWEEMVALNRSEQGYRKGYVIRSYTMYKRDRAAFDKIAQNNRMAEQGPKAITLLRKFVGLVDFAALVEQDHPHAHFADLIREVLTEFPELDTER